MSLLHFSSPEKWKTHLLFSRFAGKRISNVQTVPWEKRSWRNLYWRGDSSSTDMAFYSGPAFKHLPLHFEFVHTHVLLLKWGFSRTKYAKHLFLAGSTALVIPVNSQLDLPDRHNRQFSFPNPRNVSVVQTVAESLVLKTNWFAKQSRQKKKKNHKTKNDKDTSNHALGSIWDDLFVQNFNSKRGRVQAVPFLTQIPK